MAQKIEKLEQNTLDKIVKYQSDANQLIFELGQLYLQIREIESQLKKINEIKTQSEEKFDNIGLQLENILSDLQRKYPNAELNLEEGVIKFESAE